MKLGCVGNTCIENRCRAQNNSSTKRSTSFATPWPKERLYRPKWGPPTTNCKPKFLKKIWKLWKTAENSNGGGGAAGIDDEYAHNAGLEDPRICTTTSRDPSSRLKQFAKELKLLFPNATRISRGNSRTDDVLQACQQQSNCFDLLVVQKNPGRTGRSRHLSLAARADGILYHHQHCHDTRFADGGGSHERSVSAIGVGRIPFEFGKASCNRVQVLLVSNSKTRFETSCHVDESEWFLVVSALHVYQVDQEEGWCAVASRSEIWTEIVSDSIGNYFMHSQTEAENEYDSSEGIKNVFDPIRFLLLNLGLCKCCRFHLKNVDSIRFLQELHFSNEICNSF